MPIKQHAYHANAYKRSVMREEVDYLLENGLAVAHGVRPVFLCQSLTEHFVFAQITAKSMLSLCLIVFLCLEWRIVMITLVPLVSSVSWTWSNFDSTCLRNISLL